MTNYLKKIEAIGGVERATELVAGRRYFAYIEPNAEGEEFIIEITLIRPNNLDKNSLPNLWHKHGHTEKVLGSYICLATHLITDKGSSAPYNPMSEDSKLNFDYMLEVSPSNIKHLINEVIRRYREGVTK